MTLVGKIVNASSSFMDFANNISLEPLNIPIPMRPRDAALVINMNRYARVRVNGKCK